GSGTSSSPKEYSYKDVVPLSCRYAYRLKQIDHDGTYEYYHAAEVEVGLMPKRLELFPNVPNPFNPTTSIGFTLPEDGHGTLKVFDILGREIQTLFEGEAEAGRLHQSVFDAGSLSSGIYFSRLEYKGQVLVKKMILMR
ncbi:MAG: T9SS type A sorting domain-containing protein, partial [Bacteroidota bacterium]